MRCIASIIRIQRIRPSAAIYRSSVKKTSPGTLPGLSIWGGEVSIGGNSPTPANSLLTAPHSPWKQASIRLALKKASASAPAEKEAERHAITGQAEIAYRRIFRLTHQFKTGYRLHYRDSWAGRSLHRGRRPKVRPAGNHRRHRGLLPGGSRHHHRHRRHCHHGSRASAWCR